jgi:ankyrin repeat protein
LRMRSAHGNLDPHVVLRFLKEGGDPNAGNNSDNLDSLLVMLNPKTLELILAFAKHGADMNAANTLNKHTVLMSAVGDADLKTCEELVRLGADVNRQDYRGNTALHQVVDDGCWEDAPAKHVRAVIKLLAASGADIELVNDVGQTPLALAITEWSRDPDKKHDEIAGQLLDAGANPNCRLGTTKSKLAPDDGAPLMCQRYGKGGLHLALLKAGADPTLKCPKGLTAMDYAEKRIKAKADDASGAEKALKAMKAAADTRK